jgi:hypothetical protein
MKTGRPTSTLKLPITIDFKIPKRKNSIIKSKIIKGKTIDELLDCNFIIPGIPENAEILKVSIGKRK